MAKPRRSTGAPAVGTIRRSASWGLLSRPQWRSRDCRTRLSKRWPLAGRWPVTELERARGDDWWAAATFHLPGDKGANTGWKEAGVYTLPLCAEEIALVMVAARIDISAKKSLLIPM